MNDNAQVATLAQRVREIAAEVVRPPSLDDARAALNEAGIGAARRGLASALDGIGAAQGRLRAAQEAERNARQDHDDALATALWLLDARIEREGNRTFVTADGERRQVTADEARAWKDREAYRVAEVVDAASTLRAAEEWTAAARDGVVLAERRFSAAKADLAAAVSTLNALSTALGPPRA